MSVTILIKKKRYDITVTADDQKGAIELAAFFDELPNACPECGAVVRFTHRVVNDDNFWGIICAGEITHETTFGNFKAAKRGLYYRSWIPWQHFESKRQPE